ncbi:ABC transporter permease [Actinocorallia sp. B10E7]|uniref:ABC transporter permease n=1 Tax=Actinocorallia sp. B10E7 TaxID=3153558 RepID=UPI00325C5570
MTAPALAAPGRAVAFWALFRKELLIYRRDPLLLIMIFLVPVVLTVFLAPALGGAYALSGEPPAYVQVGDTRPDGLGAPKAVVDREDARRRVAAGEVPFAVVTEPDGRRYVIADPTLPTLLPVFLNHLSADDVPVIGPDGGPYADAASPYQQSLFGFALMNVFFGAAHAAQALHRERNWGTWNRVLSLRLGKGTILLAKMAPMAIISALQQLILIGGGCLIAGIPVHRPGFLLLASLATGCVVAAAACTIAAVSGNDMQVPQFNNLLALLGGAVAGALVPVALMPGWVQAVAPVFPQYWALDLIKGATSRDAPASALLLDLAVLCVFIVVFAVIGRLAMRWERLRHE